MHRFDVTPCLLYVTGQPSRNEQHKGVHLGVDGSHTEEETLLLFEGGEDNNQN